MQTYEHITCNPHTQHIAITEKKYAHYINQHHAGYQYPLPKAFLFHYSIYLLVNGPFNQSEYFDPISIFVAVWLMSSGSQTPWGVSSIPASDNETFCQ